MKQNQKEIAKAYASLNGRLIQVYVGRVDCSRKHVEKELSLDKKENHFGVYEEILVLVKKTHFNGKMLSIQIDTSTIPGQVRDFKISENDIPKLQMPPYKK